MKIIPIHSIKCDGVYYYDDEMSEKDLFERHHLPLEDLLVRFSEMLKRKGLDY